MYEWSVLRESSWSSSTPSGDVLVAHALAAKLVGLVVRDRHDAVLAHVLRDHAVLTVLGRRGTETEQGSVLEVVALAPEVQAVGTVLRVDMPAVAVRAEHLLVELRLG